MSVTSLRQQHSRFTYHKFSHQLTTEGLRLQFDFSIEPNIKFHPSLLISGVTAHHLDQISQLKLRKLIFYLGLAEIPSYWKVTCSPEIEVQAGNLTKNQLKFWESLLIKGLGEFFYQNKIDFTQDKFVSWTVKPKDNQRYDSPPSSKILHQSTQAKEKKRLIPVGGGKDSSLTLGIFDQNKLNYGCLLLATNSKTLPAAEKVVAVSQAREVIRVNRQIDPTLLKLNQEGFPNGHTPFSAYLSFLSWLVAYLFNYDQILMANERSANQENTIYKGKKINHQYSKSFEYEQKFRQYQAKSEINQIEYLSFLRPWYELQIARAFSKLERYHHVFKSCNQGQKQNIWCHLCPKCLFVFTLLYPFIETKKLTTQIFNQDLFENENLIQTALDLIGAGDKKPFECVGTFEETQASFFLAIKKAKQKKIKLPPVLQAIQPHIEKLADVEQQTNQILNSWNSNHNLPPKLAQLLQDSL